MTLRDMIGDPEYKYQVDVQEGRWVSCDVMIEDSQGELHYTGTTRFFKSRESADECRKEIENGADETIAYANSLHMDEENCRRETRQMMEL